MKRLVFLSIIGLALILGVLLSTPRRAKAITYGFIDSANTYSNVGAFIVKSGTAGDIFPICSGTMITSNVFLTASHCTAFFTQQLAPLGFTAYVSLDQSIPFGNSGLLPLHLLTCALSGCMKRRCFAPARASFRGVCRCLVNRM